MSGYSEEDVPGHGRSTSAKTVESLWQNGNSQDGEAQHATNPPQQLVNLTRDTETVAKSCTPDPSDLSTGDFSTDAREGEGPTHSPHSRPRPSPHSNFQIPDPFREQQPCPSKERSDSSVYRAYRLANPSSTDTVAQRSSSFEDGRVDALGPPSQDYPMV